MQKQEKKIGAESCRLSGKKSDQLQTEFRFVMPFELIMAKLKIFFIWVCLGFPEDI
jgi:hypothetical protein